LLAAAMFAILHLDAVKNRSKATRLAQSGSPSAPVKVALYSP
jgi:hypothetical protein